MAGGSNKMTSDFSDKPRTQERYEAVADFVSGLGDVTREARAQVSYAVNRKFLWLWAYEQTPDGTLYLNVTLDTPESDERVHKVTQVSANRWNHHVEVRSAATARSAWLRQLIRAGFVFASG